MNFEDTIKHFSEGTLQLDFPRLELARRAGASAEKLSGPGSLEQSFDGELELKVHVAFTDPESMVGLINRGMYSEAGALVPEGDYHDVTATDAHGATWEFERVHFDHSISLPTSSGVFTANPKVLRRGDDRGSGPRLSLQFFNQDIRDWKGLLGGPYPICLGACEIQLTIKQLREGQIRVEVTTETQFPEAFERRLIEALQFVVGQSLHTSVVDQAASSGRTIELYNRAADIRRVPSFPPLEVHTSQFTRENLDLLHCYLAFLCKQPDDGIWAQASSFLSLLRRASESSIDGWLIGICVAVEGLAGLIDLEPSALTGELAQFQQNVKEWIETEDISEGNRKRIEGMLSQMGSVRPQDRMMSLASDGKLLEEDIKVWKKARNASVHTRKSGADDLKPEKLQVRIDQLHTIYRLLYSIIFHVIGYSGKYTDYARRHFPVRSYPSDIRS